MAENADGASDRGVTALNCRCKSVASVFTLLSSRVAACANFFKPPVSPVTSASNWSLLFRKSAFLLRNREPLACNSELMDAISKPAPSVVRHK